MGGQQGRDQPVQAVQIPVPVRVAGNGKTPINFAWKGDGRTTAEAEGPADCFLAGLVNGGFFLGLGDGRDNLGNAFRVKKKGRVLSVFK